MVKTMRRIHCLQLFLFIVGNLSWNFLRIIYKQKFSSHHRHSSANTYCIPESYSSYILYNKPESGMLKGRVMLSKSKSIFQNKSFKPAIFPLLHCRLSMLATVPCDKFLYIKSRRQVFVAKLPCYIFTYTNK